MLGGRFPGLCEACSDRGPVSFCSKFTHAIARQGGRGWPHQLREAMPIGSGQKRDDRRRRVFREELNEGSEGANPGGAVGAGRLGLRKRRRYSLAARRKRQPALVDFIPTKWWTIGLASGTILGAMLLVIIAGAQVSDWAGSEPGVSSLPTPAQLFQRASVWLGSTFCLGMAVVCLQIYLVRRHRSDDYRGYYTLWLWMVAISVFASLNMTVGLHELLWQVAASILPGSLGSSRLAANLVWVLPTVAIAGRLIWEMRESQAKWGVVAGLVTAIVAAVPGWVGRMGSADSQLAGHSLLMIVPAIGLVSLVFYSRYVLLDAHGKLRQRSSSQEAELEQQDEAAGTVGMEEGEVRPRRQVKRRTSTRSRDSQSSQEAKVAGTVAAAEQAQVDDEPEPTVDEESPVIHSMSKAQKRREAKRARKQQQRRAA